MCDKPVCVFERGGKRGGGGGGGGGLFVVDLWTGRKMKRGGLSLRNPTGRDASTAVSLW